MTSLYFIKTSKYEKSTYLKWLESKKTIRNTTRFIPYLHKCGRKNILIKIIGSNTKGESGKIRTVSNESWSFPMETIVEVLMYTFP